MLRLESSLRVVMLFSFALALPACLNDTGHTSDNLLCSGDFGSTAQAQRIESFLRASADFHAAAIDVETDLGTTCHDMGVALGMSDADLYAGGTATTGSARVRVACTNVEARVQSELTAIRAGGTLTVAIEARPPHCDVSIDAYASCAAECDASVDPGSVEITCQGGEIRGQCDASCTGECATNVDVVCAGRCEGSCDGTCSASATDGSCAGSCDGACHGQCVVQSSASCTAECRGSCSVRFREPRCTGDVQAPSVMASCAADCDARVAAMATCTPGEVHLTITGTLDAALRARADRVVAAFEAGASGIYELRSRAAILATSGSILVSTASTVPDDAASLGAGAFACATASAARTAEAASSLSVSVDVSVHVSGTIRGSAS